MDFDLMSMLTTPLAHHNIITVNNISSLEPRLSPSFAQALNILMYYARFLHF